MCGTGTAREEILERMGFIPPLLESAGDAPEVLRNLWSLTVAGYLDNPLPGRFKEELFAYLSRFCEAPYCLVCHSCALRALGRRGPEVLALLEEAPPTAEVDVAAHLAGLAAVLGPLEEWPAAGTPLDRALFRCAVAFFRGGSGAGPCRAELRRVLGPVRYSHLLSLLGYIRACHVWSEGHPEITWRSDRRAADHLEPLLEEEPRLRDFFDRHAERVRQEGRATEDRLLQAVSGLRQRETEVRRTRDRLETRVQELTTELSRLGEGLSEETVRRGKLEEERDRLSAQLLQGQKLQAIGHLSVGIAHEINNPVGFILSNLGTIREYLGDLKRLLEAALEAAGEEERKDPARKALERLRRELDAPYLLEDFGKALDETRQGAERIRDIVKSLREFSHVDDGELRPADLNECIENSLRLVWNELKYSAQVRRDYGPVPPVPCHPQRLGQVFVNLLVNAAQALGGKGEIAVSTRVEGDEAVVRIRDTGCGIPEEVLPRIFEPFFTTKPVGKGTGLGLHVAHTIVQSHGGRIEVRSSVGVGTEFAVRLPRAGPAAN